MDKVVNLHERIESKKQEKQLEQNRGKIDTIRRVVQCSSCHFRCAMCGRNIEEPDQSYSSASASGPANAFCESCRGEFEDFMSISDGQHSEVFWHNEEWLNMWSAWLNYRQAMAHFVKSSEFQLLLK